MEFSFGQMVVNTWAILSTIFDRVMDKCTGRMEMYTKANGATDAKQKKFPNLSI